MAGAWPGRAGDPFADWFNRVPKYVVSSTLTEADLTWGPTEPSRAEPLALWYPKPTETRGFSIPERAGQPFR